MPANFFAKPLHGTVFQKSGKHIKSARVQKNWRRAQECVTQERKVNEKHKEKQNALKEH